MNKKSDVGKVGEDIACEFLLNKGFTLIERNFRKPWGELDVIAKDRDGTLVFVEVKTIRQSGNGSAGSPQDAAILPEENLTSAKLKKLQRTASLYVGFHGKQVDDNKGWRIDLLAIAIPVNVVRETHSQNNLTKIIEHCDIKHYENI